MLSTSVFQTLRLSMFSGDPTVIEDTLGRAADIQGVHSLSIAKSQGVINTFGLSDTMSDDPKVIQAFESGNSSWYENQGSAHTVRLLKPLKAEAVCLQCHALNKEGDVLGVMDLTLSLDDVDHMIAGAQWQMTLFMVISALAAFGIVIVFLRYVVTEPLNNLMQTARDLSSGEGDLSKRLDVKRDDEIGTTSRYVNQFIEKIAGVIENAKNAASANMDASLELDGISKSLTDKISTLDQRANESSQMIQGMKGELDTNEEIAIRTADL